MQWSILWQWFLKFQFKVSPQCNWNKRSVAMYPPSLNITYLNKWAVFQICFVVFPFLTQLNLWVQKRRQVVYKFMFHQLNLLVRLISLNFKTNKKTWRVIFSFLILVASCVCIPLNIPYLYTNGLSLPSNPVWGNICILSETWRNWKNQQIFWRHLKRKENLSVGNLRPKE